MEDMTKPLENPQLLAAVEQMNRENSRESREAVLDLVISSARFLAPVTITPPPQTSPYSSVEEILGFAEEKGEKPFIVILDE